MIKDIALILKQTLSIESRNKSYSASSKKYRVLILASPLILFIPLFPVTVPFVYSQYSFITKWGFHGTGNGQFINPNGIAIDSSGNVYVSDVLNHRIQKFSSDGKFITKWGSFGAGNGQFSGLAGIAIDSMDNVYVVDSINNLVQKFSSDGKFITKWGSEGNASGQFEQPNGIALDSSGYAFIVDSGNSRVQKFSSDGKFITKWGSYCDITRIDTCKASDDSIGALQRGDLNFSEPRGIGIDHKNNTIYISDFFQNGNRTAARIQEFGSDGKFITKWGSYCDIKTGFQCKPYSGLAPQQKGSGQFDVPTGIAVNSIGHVFVADTGNNRIQEFTGSGKFITKWGSLGVGNGQFNSPSGIAISPLDKTFITDSGNQRIEVFAPTH